MSKDPLPEKILPYKTYNKIGHLSKSRLGKGDHFIDATTEKMLTQKLEDQTSVIIVQEKLDGSNVSVVRWQGEIRALGRSGFDCQTSNQEQYRMFWQWVQNHKYQFEALLPAEEDRVVGEWLALAHGTQYWLSHAPFVAFDLFSGQKNVSYFQFVKKCSEFGFVDPNVLHIGGACGTNRALKLLTENRHVHGSEDPEGVIYRLEKAGVPRIIAKLVKQNKEDGKFLKEGKEIWNWDGRVDTDADL